MDTDIHEVLNFLIYIRRISTAIIAFIHRIGKSFALPVGIEPTYSKYILGLVTVGRCIRLCVLLLLNYRRFFVVRTGLEPVRSY